MKIVLFLGHTQSRAFTLSDLLTTLLEVVLLFKQALVNFLSTVV